jgi:hypothetical protein
MLTGPRQLTAAAMVAIIGFAAPACAAQRRFGYPPGVWQGSDRAYTSGYNEGRKEGEDDGRRGRRFDCARHDEFRDADKGYRGNGPRGRYREIFREGFIEGYSDGYRRYARAGSIGPRASNRYPDGIYDRRGGRYASPAAQVGFRDGYDEGRDDARDRDPFDPVRSSRYRSGDHDYDSRYGSRDAYKRDYREGFRQGYEQGYRENDRRR